jgi:CIC family chloride channel protein
MNDTPSPSEPGERPDEEPHQPFPQGLSDTIRSLPNRLGERTLMILLGTVIGIAGGFGAVFFRWLIGAIHGLAWMDIGTPLENIMGVPWYWRMLVPAAGGLVVGLIVRFLAPEVKGHGVPEVMHSVARQGGVIRPVVAVAKSLASAVCIGTGGSVGREGPIVQIGSAIGSTLGQIFRLSTRRIRTCVGCGAAAGIAATFNAPIAGAFFAAEVILGQFEMRSFGAVVIASVAATVISHVFLGDILAFQIPEYSLVHPAEILPYAILGLLAGLAAVAFVWTLHWFEDFFDRLRSVPSVLKPALGGLGIGAIGIVLPQVMGVGYDTIEGALNGQLLIGILIAVFAVKLVATSLTLGSGGSGGIFAPSLFMGSALGGVVGHAAGAVLPFPVASPGAYAVVGMGAMVAAATHAPITAIVIIFEMTGDYRVILGLMVSCILGAFLAQRLRRESIYTIKLVRRGIDLSAGQEINVLRRMTVHDVLRRSVETVPRTANLEDLYQRMVESNHYEFFTVDGDGNLIGIVSVDDLRRALPLLEELKQVAIAEDIAQPANVYVREDDTLDTAMRQFGKRTYEELPVLPAGGGMRPVGTISRGDVINAYNREILKVDLAGSLSSRIATAAKLKTWETVGGYVLAHMDAPLHLCGRTLESLRPRRTYGVLIILVERTGEDESRYRLADRSTVLQPGDKIIAFGRRDAVERVARISE